METSVVADTSRTIEVKQKMHFTGKVVKIRLAGAVVDIGLEKPAVLHISQIVAPDNQPINGSKMSCRWVSRWKCG